MCALQETIRTTYEYICIYICVCECVCVCTLLNEYPEFTEQFDRAPAQMQETLLTT